MPVGPFFLQFSDCNRFCNRLRAEIRFLPLCSHFQIGIAHYIVPLEYRPGLMTAYHHGGDWGERGLILGSRVGGGWMFLDKWHWSA